MQCVKCGCTEEAACLIRRDQHWWPCAWAIMEDDSPTTRLERIEGQPGAERRGPLCTACDMPGQEVLRHHEVLAALDDAMDAKLVAANPWPLERLFARTTQEPLAAIPDDDEPF